MIGAAYRGRFAPSPTGDLHLGSAAAALVAWLRARAAGGTFVVRVEDIDRPRVVPGAEARQLDELRWLGLDWDEGPDVGGPHAPYRQSKRSERYVAALELLEARGLLFRCDCSRSEIARVASAPHAGEDGPRYPGTCRRFGMQERPWRRAPAVRVVLPPGPVTVYDAWQGAFVQDPAATVGDVVLRRGDGVWSYQLACVVDDLAMGITEVVRGHDLLASAPRQVLLARALGGTPPAFAHLPLVVSSDGTRLAKRAGGTTLGAWRRAGRPPEAVVGVLAYTLGLRPAPAPIAARDLVREFDPAALSGRATVRLPADVFSG
ncbi:MAG TPA: tRNA glutamyl-Q(34) synthetase GluQRS [Candidatus Limnocylindria bacterium]|nr:tRNA glutamyl-Q(34) synthetase GluQRS [Candidatus Limnocylindria bacterium]